LQYHPDKLVQRGITITPQLQKQFIQVKEAYDVLSHPQKRDTYDTIGYHGMKYIEEPFSSIDPQTLLHNFAKSSVLDRSKIFVIFIVIAIVVFLQPILLCLQVDGYFGPDALYTLTFVPLWIWNIGFLFYHIHVICMGPIQRPEHIPVEEWVDPLPMDKRISSMVRFILIVAFQLLIVFKLDHFLSFPWYILFVPYYLWEATNIYKNYSLSTMRIVTVHDLEVALGKPYSEFTSAEKDLIGKRYSVVANTTCPEYEIAMNIRLRAQQHVRNSWFRFGFVVLLLVQLDGPIDWNWYIVFAPIWIMTFIVCFINYHTYIEVRTMVMEKDPTFFQMNPNSSNHDTTPSYGSVHTDGNHTTSTETTMGPTPAVHQSIPLTDEEKEQLRAQFVSSSSKFYNRCCSQTFAVLLLLLLVGKIQGAKFSSLWILSPFLFVVRFYMPL
jgi:Transmembrane Fragile-X-F protein/DnaJ domain